MPGICASHTNGRAHQISRATASAASAPPNWLPSESKKRSSRNNSAFGKPSSAPTRGSWSGLAVALKNRQQPSRHPRADSALRVKKQPPPRVPPFPIRKLRLQRNHVLLVGQPFLAVLSRLYSWSSPCPLCPILVNSVLNLFASPIADSSRLLLLRTQQRNHLPPQLHHALQRPRRHPQNLLEQSCHRR